MENTSERSQMLNKFRPYLEQFNTKTIIWITFLLILIAFGIYALIIQIVKGHIVTGMRDNVVWGIYIANFSFFIGLAYAGAIISGMFRILKVKWRLPLVRIAKMMTVIAAVIGPIFILLCIGRLDRLHYLIIYPRLQSPIIWDVFAVSTFLVGSIIFLYLGLIRDFSLLSNLKDLKVAPWRKKLYAKLSLGFKNKPEQNQKLNFSLNVMSIMIIPIAIIVSSIVSWIFGMTLRPGWHSTIFGPYFVLASVYSGTGVLIVALYIFRKIYKLEKYITPKHFIYLSYILLALAFGYGYFTFAEYLTDWYGSDRWHAELVAKLFDLNEFGWLFLFTNIVGILLPIIVIGIPQFRTIKSITIVSLLMVLAMWVKRYLIVVPTLETTLIPMQDLRPEYVKYAITWVEWALTFGGLATFLLFFTLVSKLIPIIPVWEISEIEETEETTTSAIELSS